MEQDVKRLMKKEILIAVIGGILAISALFLVYISDLYVLANPIYCEEKLIDKNFTQIPMNSTVLYFYPNSSSYRTKLSITGDHGVIVLGSRVYNLTLLKKINKNLIGIARFNVTYVEGNISYSYIIERIYKPYNFLALPAFFLAMIGNVAVIISLYRIIMLRARIQ
ncbi:hypothetical protein [Staphylothermus hellenicus]|uniref:Uncharacterized protein n=1 Tax=Staphylothermus hellenicus (strain DSM 12710 / JCM 10830 / BK20S6-10-b1 / P8) TaxID=591019 RepID=D7D8X4_STAHD|nr:hypothetical protein [Staphylothermus hellenicus]ADI32220.1 hypothetical protein Shell_1118 [Staphylothermus hellenicus DSM 12710]